MAEEKQSKLPENVTQDDPGTNDIILVGKPQELKPAMTILLGMAQLFQKVIDTVEEIHGGKQFDDPPVTGHPKVTLYFAENKYKAQEKIAKDSEYTPAAAEISFRLMNKTAQTITQADLVALGKAVRSKFVKPLFILHKGQKIVSYYDKSKGCKMRLYVKDEAEGARLIEQALDIIKQSPDWTKSNLSSPVKQQNKAQALDIERPIILGKKRKIVRRPTVDVEFQHARIMIPGLRKAIYLIDMRARHKAVVNAYGD